MLVAVVLPCVASEISGAGMEAGHVGRNGQHVLAVAELGQALYEQIVQLGRREIGFDTSYGAIQAHSRYPVLFNSKYELYLTLREKCPRWTGIEQSRSWRAPIVKISRYGCRPIAIDRPIQPSSKLGAQPKRMTSAAMIQTVAMSQW